MATSSYLIKIGADASSVTKSISQVNRDIASAGKASRDLDKAFKFNGDTSALNQKLTVLGGALDLAKAKSDSLNKELTELKGSPGFDANSVKAQKLSNEIMKADAEVTKLSAEMDATKKMKLSVDSSEVANAKNPFVDLANTGGSAIRSLVTGLGKIGIAAVATAGAVAGAGIGKLLADGLKEAVSAYENFQGLQATFDFAGRTQKEFESAKKFIQDYSAATEFSAADITQAWTQMGLDGSKASQQLISGLGGVTQAAADPGEAMKALLPQLAQVQTAGKLMNEDYKVMKQYMGKDIVDALQASMEKAGAFQGSFQDALSNGEISAEEFNAAIRDVGNNPALQDQAKSASTLSGAIGAAGGSISSALLPIVEQVMPKITEGIQGVGDGIANFISSIDFESIFNDFNNLSEMLGTIFDTIDTSALTGAFETIGGQISGMLPSFTEFQGFISNLASGFADMINSMDFSGLVDLATSIIPALQSGFKTFLSYVTPAVQPLVDAFVNLWNNIQPVVSVIADMLTPAFNILGAFLGGFVSGVMQALTTAFNVGATVIGALTPVIQAVGAVFNWLAPIFTTIAGFIGTLMGSTTAFSGIFSSMGKVVSSIGSGVNKMFSSIMNYGRSLFSSLGSAFSGIGSAFSSLGNAIGGTVGSIINWFVSMPGNIMGAIGNIAGRIGGAFSGVVGSITSAIGNVASIGKNIIDGIIGGIGGAVGGLITAATDAVGSALNAAKKKLGIHSPSRVFRDEVGRYMTEGISVGMLSDLDQFKEDAKEISNASVRAFEGLPAGTLSPEIIPSIASNSQQTQRSQSNSLNIENITIENNSDTNITDSMAKQLVQKIASQVVYS